jgi:threonine aldolase
MIRFECDYLEGAHPKIIHLLTKSNLIQTPGYGTDEYCEKARNLIKQLCNSSDSDVHFLVGGTQTNKTVIASILRPHQGVLSAVTGHINVHETGAIEATGHKVLPLPSEDGKLTAEQIELAYTAHSDDHEHEHLVQPGMVYISNPTESGTIYSKQELTAISTVCRKYNLPLFLDGARLGYGLMADGNDISVPDLSELCDVFYIGGTKVGALFGEAVVISNPKLQKDFRYYMKQNGGMLAKGRLLGIQFLALLEDGLYFDIAKQANIKAIKIKETFIKKGIPLYIDSVTNQQFPILTEDVANKLKNKYSFSFWEKIDDTKAAYRFCTSWATTNENVEQLISDINKIVSKC